MHTEPFYEVVEGEGEYGVCDCEEKTIKSNLDIGEVESLLYYDVDAGESVDRYGVDKAGEYIDSDNNKPITFLVVFFPRFCHYLSIIYSTNLTHFDRFFFYFFICFQFVLICCLE